MIPTTQTILATTCPMLPGVPGSMTTKRVSFEDIAKMLQGNQIERYFIDDLIQYQTNRPNNIMTFIGKDGNIYLANVKYDKTTNQIFPPV